jgi:hypothetical protein
MKYYLQVNQETNIITDMIDYPYSDYVEYEGTITEPVHGGWFKLEDGIIVEYPELKPEPVEDEFDLFNQ